MWNKVIKTPRSKYAKACLNEVLENFQKLFCSNGQRKLWIVGDDKFAFWQFFFNIQYEQISVFRDAVIRNKSDSQANPGKINQKVIASQFNLRDQVKLILLEQVVEKLTGGAFSIQHHDRIGKQVFQMEIFIF